MLPQSLKLLLKPIKEWLKPFQIKLAIYRIYNRIYFLFSKKHKTNSKYIYMDTKEKCHTFCPITIIHKILRNIPTRQ